MTKLNQLKKKCNDAYSKLVKKPFGIPSQLFEDDLSIFDVKIPKLIIQGKELYGRSILNEIQFEWEKYFADGKRNFRKEIFTINDVQMNDSSYFCLTNKSATELINQAYYVSRNILGAVYSKQIFDCDDFMKLISGLSAIIGYNSGIKGSGIGIGMIKISYEKEGNLSGHALNFIPMIDGNKLNMFLYESQGTNFYRISDKTTRIHFIDI